MNDQLESVAQVKNTLTDLAIKFGPKVLIAIVILGAGFFVGRWIGRAMDRMLTKLHLEAPIRQLLARTVRILVLVLFVIKALRNLGVELLPLIAGIGIARAGIALAMQGVLSNVVAGLTIIFTRPFRVGEYVSMIGEEGQVDRIGLFNTTLTHPDLSRVVIPNRKIVGEVLHNYGNIRQVDLLVVLPDRPEPGSGCNPQGSAGQPAGAQGSRPRDAGGDACRLIREHRSEALGQSRGLPCRRRREQQSHRGDLPRAEHRHPVSTTRSATPGRRHLTRFSGARWRHVYRQHCVRVANAL
jgi:mechanosensitive ion channel-like protein